MSCLCEIDKSRRDRLFVFAATWLLTVAMGSTAASCQTSNAAPSCPPVRDAQGNLVTPAQCAPSTPTAPPATRFPYPGDPTPAAAQGAGNAEVPQSPAPPSTPQAPASKRFPYPGEPTDQGTPGAPNSPGPPSTPAAAGQGPLQDAGSSGSSSSGGASSSSSSSNSAADQDEQGSSSSARPGTDQAKDPDADDPAAIPRSKRHKLPPTPRQSPSEREQEDVQVAGFYFNDGNFLASYDRAKDATSLDGDDAEAQLALGNAARKLGKLDEAEKAYRHCLELDPIPKVRKPAEKALHEMKGD